MRRILLLAAALVLAAACSQPASPGPEKLKIFVTTDIHGHLSYDPDQGQLGLARLQSYIQDAAEAGYKTILLDSGDVFSGSALAQVDRGRFVAEMMGRMGYRVLTPGNHAFDHNELENNYLYYSEILLKTLREHSPGPVEVTVVNLSYQGAELPGTVRRPVLLYDESDIDPEGRRVIVAGVTTPYNAMRSSQRPDLADYDFGRVPGDGPEAAAATKAGILTALADRLGDFDRPNDIVIVLSHLGQAERSDQPEGRVLSLDLAEVPNVDFVADGHSHQAQAPQTIGTAVFANGGCYLQSFLEITLEPGRDRMELKTFEQLAEIQPDPAIEARLAEFEARHGLDEILFLSPDAAIFSPEDLRTKSTPLGRLIGRTMREVSGADLALHGSGAIRAGLPAGPVTARRLYDVVPFGDDLVSYRMTGREIFTLFEGFFSDSRRFTQFYGPSLQVRPTGEGERFQLVEILDKEGQALDPDREYLVAMNSFMAKSLRRNLAPERRAPAKNDGALAPALIQRLRETRDLDFDGLRADNVLIVGRPAAVGDPLLDPPLEPAAPLQP